MPSLKNSTFGRTPFWRQKLSGIPAGWDEEIFRNHSSLIPVLLLKSSRGNSDLWYLPQLVLYSPRFSRSWQSHYNLNRRLLRKLGSLIFANRFYEEESVAWRCIISCLEVLPTHWTIEIQYSDVASSQKGKWTSEPAMKPWWLRASYSNSNRVMIKAVENGPYCWGSAELYWWLVIRFVDGIERAAETPVLNVEHGTSYRLFRRYIMTQVGNPSC